MYFYNLIKNLSEKKDILLFVDMDGVIAAYNNGGNPYDFLHKRPLKQNISTIKEVSTLENVDLHILSVCRENFQISDKNVWLDENAPFFKKDGRVIISRESKEWKTAKEIKLEYLKSVKTDKQIVLIDDDNEVLRTIRNELEHVIALQDSELID